MDIELHQNPGQGCYDFDLLRTLQIDVTPFAWVIGVATVNPSSARALTRYEKKCSDAIERCRTSGLVEAALHGNEKAIRTIEDRVRNRENRVERVMYDGVKTHWLTASSQSSS